jgi:hypothetical protein
VWSERESAADRSSKVKGRPPAAWRSNPFGFDPHGVQCEQESVCAEGNRHVEIGGQNYFMSGDGRLMPAKKTQAQAQAQAAADGGYAVPDPFLVAKYLGDFVEAAGCQLRLAEDPELNAQLDRRLAITDGLTPGSTATAEPAGALRDSNGHRSLRIAAPQKACPSRRAVGCD